MIELLILLFFFKSEESYFLSSLDTIIQKKHLVPEVTELWAPIPSIVDPGDNFQMHHPMQ